MQEAVGLVAGSHNSNELIVIRRGGEFAVPPKSFENLSKQICHICEDDVGLTEEGELFVACDECAFAICRTCYEYERREGSQVCPQCKTRFKRLKGCARVEGDEEEDDIDDLENEFNFNAGTASRKDPIPLLTDDQMVDDIPPDQRALVPSSLATNGGNEKTHLLPFQDSAPPVKPRPLNPSKDLAAYGFGSVAWKERLEIFKQRREQLQLTSDEHGDSERVDHDDDGPGILMDEARQPLSRKLPIPASQLNPYRMSIIIRLVVLAFFFHHRVTHPVNDAYALWLVSVICEIWFAILWVFDQFPKWLPTSRKTYLDRLSLRYEKESHSSQLSPIDIFVNTTDPLKEPPLVTANTVLSILAVDYPVDKVSCYVSDDGAAMLTFEALSETSEFAKKWVPFCKKFGIEPRAPEWYFAQKMDYLTNKVEASFVKERRAMKRAYEEYKVRINGLVAKARKAPEEGWTMQDGTSWPGNNVRDHPGMIQVFLGQNGGHDRDGNELPRLVYVSREKRHGFNHHKKAGAMNALVRVSAVLTNSPYLLNLDYNHYINNCQVLREAMCFMMDPLAGKGVCYVQFPLRFDSTDRRDTDINQNTIFLDINMKGLDGIQGPVYVGTGCMFRRQALYGYDAPKSKRLPPRMCDCLPKWRCASFCLGKREKKKVDRQKMGLKKRSSTSITLSALESIQKGVEEIEGKNLTGTSDAKIEKRFGQSPAFARSALLKDDGALKSANPASLLTEAIHVISCGYEDKTEWGKQIGWLYGCTTEDMLTSFKMHCRGWKSIYCTPPRPAFKGSIPSNISHHLDQVLGCAFGSIEIFFSKHCPLWYGYGGGLKWLERLYYINATVYPWTSIPLLAYCTLPSVCLLTGKFIIPELSTGSSLLFLSLFISIFTTNILEMGWSGVGINEWWRNEQFWVIGGVSAHLFAVFQGLLKVLLGIETNLTMVPSTARNDEELSKLQALKQTTMLIPPTTLLIINLIAVVAGVSNAISNGYESWGLFFGKLFFACWVIVHLHPCLKDLMGRQNRTPKIIVLWSISLASVFFLLWVRMDPFLTKSNGPALEECGLECN